MPKELAVDKWQRLAGKGGSPRNCFSQEFRDNYDNISWGKPKTENSKKRKSSERKKS